MNIPSVNALIDKAETNFQDSILQYLGIKVHNYDKKALCLVINEIDNRHLQPEGVVNGGVYLVMAETAASMAAASLVDIKTHHVLGMEINANHMRPSFPKDKIYATATCEFQGSTTMVFSVDITNQHKKRISLARCTIAVRKRA